MYYMGSIMESNRFFSFPKSFPEDFDAFHLNLKVNVSVPWMDGMGSPNGKVTLPRAFSEAKDVRPLEARQRLPSVFSASCSSVTDLNEAERDRWLW